MVSASDQPWDAAAIRRALRLLGSHSPRIDDPQSTARALRLVWDIIQRRGTRAEIFQLPGTMTLVVVGDGPILLITHLDDPHPFAQVDDSGPPSMNGDTVSAPGITRKGGVMAALGAVLGDESTAERVTLVIESDRHDGSQAFSSWLDSNQRQYSAALCEIADLPVTAPALFLAATGLVTLRIILRDDSGPVERVYGGVHPDIGHQLVAALSALKSGDGEVLVPGFYDGVVTPEAEGLAALQRAASSVGAWLTRGAPPTEDQLSSSQLTLAAFLAPSIILRDLFLDGAGPHMASGATAVIEARIMPGQDAETIARSISDFVLTRIPDATIETLLLQPAAMAGAFDAIELSNIAPMFPVAAGNSPAELLNAAAIPTLGFSTVSRDPASFDEHVSLASIAEHSRMIQALTRLVADAQDATGPPR